MNKVEIDRFIDLSGAVKTDDLDMAEVGKVGVTDAEARILRYMADTETHTILYLRDLLAGHIAHDPDVTSFLSIWAYEELWHGRALDRLLTAAGRPAAADHFTQVSQKVTWREPVEALLSHAAAYATPRFAATHMTWGAINELTAAAAYKALERRTKNRPLAALLARIAKQERKHFAFYYGQAEERLKGDRFAQNLCKFALKAFWAPVGSGVGHEDNLGFVAAHLFSDPVDRRALLDAENTIRKLPGMQDLDLVVKRTDRVRVAYIERFGAPEQFKASNLHLVDAAATA